jgi:hypothetical protein
MAIWLKFKVYILAITGTLSALFGVYLYGRNRGSTDTKVKIERADHAKAKQIQDAADRARRADGDNLPAIERLRRANRIRDL